MASIFSKGFNSVAKSINKAIVKPADKFFTGDANSVKSTFWHAVDKADSGLSHLKVENFLKALASALNFNALASKQLVSTASTLAVEPAAPTTSIRDLSDDVAIDVGPIKLVGLPPFVIVDGM